MGKFNPSGLLVGLAPAPLLICGALRSNCLLKLEPFVVDAVEGASPPSMPLPLKPVVDEEVSMSASPPPTLSPPPPPGLRPTSMFSAINRL